MVPGLFVLVSDKLNRRPFVVIFLSLVAGILLAEIFRPVYWLCVAAFLITSIFIFLSNRRSLLLILFLIVIVGGLRFSLSQMSPPDHIKHIIPKLGSEKISVQGKIMTEPELYADKSKILIEVNQIEHTKTQGKMLLFIKERSRLQYGEQIKFRASLQQPRKNNNPYAFNYKDYLESKQIYATAFLFSEDNIEVLTSSKNLYYYLIIQPRRWIRQRIDGIYNAREAGFLKAIILGEKCDLPDKLQTDFANSGLSHILAVSGLHTGVIALILLVLFQIIFRKRGVARIITIVVLIYYIFLSHAAPSVQRAVIMISLFLLGRMFQRNIENVNILFAAGFVILLLQPAQLFSVGFQFSFLSVFSILVVLPLTINLIRPIRAKCSSLFWLLNLMLVSLVVQLILAPLTSLYFNKIALGGILANVLAIPLISVILPLGLLTTLIPLPFVTQFYVASEKLLLHILFYISHFVSANKVLLIDFFAIKSWQAWSIMALMGLMVLFWDRRAKRRRRIFVIGAGFLLIVSLFFLPGFFSEQRLQITVLDVKTGDAIFIQSPAGKNILIDTGNKTNKNNFAKQVIIPFFRSSEVSHLDLLILTHPHADHIGGAEYILDRIDVDEIILPKCSYKSQIYFDLLKTINQNNLNKTYADTSLTFHEFPRLKMKILAPYLEYSAENLNNYSVVVKCVYNKFSCILTGDAEEEVENWLVKTYASQLDIDFLKVCHHGSRSSSTLEFIRATSPEYGAISVGKYNRFGLPNLDVIERLKGNGVTVFRTDKDGAVIFSTDGEILDIKTILSRKEIVDNSI